MASVASMNAQCIRTNLYPNNTVISNNIGIAQIFTEGAYSTEYSKLTNLLVGTDYIFTVTSEDVNKFITVTDWSNTVIAFGVSPLTVPAITSADIHLHYADDAACNAGFTVNTVSIQAVLPCSPPAIVSVSAITTTGATVSWTPQGTETAWQTLVLLNDSPAPTTATVGDASSVTSISPTGLLPNTTYQFYVRASCASELSPWNGPINFTTNCLPVTTLNESFESTAVDALPSCWTAVVSPGNASVGVQQSGAVSGTKAVALANSFSEPGTTIMLVLPNLSNVSAGTYRLKFFAETWDTATLEIGTVDSATLNGYFTSITEIELTSVNNEYTVDFSSYSGTDTFIAFKNTSELPFSSIFIDDIRWELAPLCPDVTDLAINATTDTTAALTWEANGSETQWEVVYGAASVNDPTTLTPLSPLVNAVPETVLTGLTPNTSYNVWVRSVCGGTDGNGAWIGPISFTTACVSVATFQQNFDSVPEGDFPECWTSVVEGISGFGSGVSIYSYGGYSGSNAIQMLNGNATTNASIILVSPNLATLTTNSHRVKFFASSNTAGQTLEIGTINNPNVSGYFSPLATVTLTGLYQEFTVDFSDYSGTETFIGFKHTSTDIYSSIFLDDIRWELTPFCDDVTNLVATVVSTSSASINWEANGSETQWDVVYGPSTVTDPNILTPVSPAVFNLTETTLTGLTPNTEYNVWVRSACGGTDGNGAWIGPLVVHTPCLATALVDEDFETIGFEELPDCFSTFINGPTVDAFASVYGVEFNTNSGNSAVQLYNGTSNSTNDYVVLVLPNLSTLATATHRLKFYARTGYDLGSVNVGTLDGTTSSATFTPFENIVVNENYAEYIIEFTSYLGTDTFVGIRNTSGANISVFVDDIRWEVAPLCADVANIESTDITTTTATINWIQQGSETQWDVVYTSNPAIEDPTALTPISPAPASNPSATLSALTPNTNYKVWVRSVCGGTDGNGVWMGPISFTTKCNATSVPYSQNFENASVPSLPPCSIVENFSAANAWNTTALNEYGFTSNVLRYAFTCGAAADTWFYTQGLTLNAGTTYRISYKYGSNSTGYTEKMKIAYGTSPSVDGMTEILANHPMINFNTAVTNEVTFTPTASDTYYFGFHAYSDSCQFYLYVDDIIIDTNLSNTNVTLTRATLYPNPVNDVLTISHPENISNVSIYNLLGQKVFDRNYNDTQIKVDVASLASGTYLIKTIINNQPSISKIIKQ